MEDIKKMHPLRFLPDVSKMPWGTLEYRLADLGFIDSMVAEGWLGGNTISDLVETYLERIVGEASFDWYGTQFPVMVKYLDVKGCTSLHVNPDDETAEQRYDAFGKTALWYVESCGENARIFLGFKRDVTAQEFYSACQDGSVTALLHSVKPSPGDSYLITPGLVHAAQDVKLLEIAESSELSFRLWDWGSLEREINLEEAIDLIDYRSWRKSVKTGSIPQFRVNSIELTEPLRNEPGPSEDSFVLYIGLRGRANLICEGVSYKLEKGSVLLVPAELSRFELVPQDTAGAHILEVRVEARNQEEPEYGGD